MRLSFFYHMKAVSYSSGLIDWRLSNGKNHLKFNIEEGTLKSYNFFVFLAVIIIVAAVLFLTVYPTTADNGRASSITAAELRSHVEFLASPELEGREAGHLGAEIAARYIASHFKGLGLEAPEGASDYYQEVPLVVMRPDFQRTIMSVVIKNDTTDFITDEDVYFFPKGGDDTDITAKVVLCGYGITAPEYDYDDYREADVEGKIVLIFNREPQENDSNSVFNGAENTKYTIPMVKARIAKEHGAQALLIMRPPVESQPPIESTLNRYRERLKKPIVQLSGKTESLPVFYLTEKAAEILLYRQVDIEKYHRKIEKNLESEPVELEEITLKLTIRFKQRDEIVSPNVVGYLPGANPKKATELLIIGAHYDHEGINDDVIYPGADDNASGVSGLLELAEAFTLRGLKPQRSILFIAFTAEEKGTLGSLFYTMNPLYPLINTIGMINMDEIGRNGAPTFRGMHDPNIEEKNANYVMALYSAQTPLLREINQEANLELGLEIDFDPNLVFHGASDHVHFHDQGIPSIFYFTGFHPDYTSPRDTPDKINFPKMEHIVRLIYGVSETTLNLENRPVFDKTIKTITKKKRMSF